MIKDNLMNTYKRFDVVFERGLGAKLYDIQGKEYIDFVSGVAVNCLGHSHPSLINAIEEQCKNLIHISNLFWNEKQLKLAEKLVEYSNHEKVFFCNSGTEAVEAALKLARKFGKKASSTEKNKIIYMENSFHGRTLGALAVTGQEKYQKDYMPLMTGVVSAVFNDIDDLKSKIDENTCAVIIEPIQGEGGINEANEYFLKEARTLCDKYNALLIFDEVQCGIGRTGYLFAYQSLGVIPDVLCLAKALGGGFPIGAVLAKGKAAEVFEPGDHGSTFGGNPLACSVSLAVLEELVKGDIINDVKIKAKYLVDNLQNLKEKYGVIKEIKGKGLMIGISVDCELKEFVKKCFDKGLLLVGAGEDIVRILPPLNVTTEEIDDALKIIEQIILSV